MQRWIHLSIINCSSRWYPDFPVLPVSAQMWGANPVWMGDTTHLEPTPWVKLWGSHDFQPGASVCSGHASRHPYPWHHLQLCPEHAETCNSRSHETHRNHFCHDHQPWLKFCPYQISTAAEWESCTQTKPAHRDERWIHPFLTHQENC